MRTPTSPSSGGVRGLCDASHSRALVHPDTSLATRVTDDTLHFPPIRLPLFSLSLSLPPPQDGITSLHIAARDGHSEITKMLLDANGDPNAANKVSDHFPPFERGACVLGD